MVIAYKRYRLICHMADATNALTHADLERLMYALDQDESLYEDVLGESLTPKYRASGRSGKIRCLSKVCSSSHTKTPALTSLLHWLGTTKQSVSGEVTPSTTQTTPVLGSNPTVTTTCVGQTPPSAATSSTPQRLPYTLTYTRPPPARVGITL